MIFPGRKRAQKFYVEELVRFAIVMSKLNTLFFFLYKNIFYKNIEAEICEILRIF